MRKQDGRPLLSFLVGISVAVSVFLLVLHFHDPYANVDPMTFTLSIQEEVSPIPSTTDPSHTKHVTYTMQDTQLFSTPVATPPPSHITPTRIELVEFRDLTVLERLEQDIIIKFVVTFADNVRDDWTNNFKEFIDFIVRLAEENNDGE